MSEVYEKFIYPQKSNKMKTFEKLWLCDFIIFISDSGKIFIYIIFLSSKVLLWVIWVGAL